MSRLKSRVVLTVGALVCLAVNAPAQQTSTATETKKFEVIAVDGNQLVVNLPEGTREITVPDDFRFNIDGKQMSVNELKPGMTGSATWTTITKTETVYVTEVREAEALARALDHGGGAALAELKAAPGYERALAAALGDDIEASLGGDGPRRWQGSTSLRPHTTSPRPYPRPRAAGLRRTASIASSTCSCAPTSPAGWRAPTPISPTATPAAATTASS